jgi:transposase-like protein
MAQHFLLSAAARTLSLRSIYKEGEEVAYETFRKLRWQETDGEAVCPRCGCTETYDISSRRKFKCCACHHQFSVTSGTIFASRKMAFVDLLAAICIFVNGAKGVSALQLFRDLDCQYKTAFVLSHKLREAMANEVHTGELLDGHVEIDGAVFGGHIRPQNFEADRIDRRLKKHQTAMRAFETMPLASAVSFSLRTEPSSRYVRNSQRMVPAAVSYERSGRIQYRYWAQRHTPELSARKRGRHFESGWDGRTWG